jgi:hypothetical protein
MTWIREEEFLWGLSIYQTRAISVEYPKNLPSWIASNDTRNACGAFAPIFDMINFSHQPNLVWNNDFKRPGIK